jgi:hypothetical protein
MAAVLALAQEVGVLVDLVEGVGAGIASLFSLKELRVR